jgi:DNA repair protein RadC
MALYTESELAILKQAHDIYASKMQSSQSFTSADVAGEYIRSLLAHEKREMFAVIYLNSQHVMIGESAEILFKGDIASASVYPRIIAQKALENNAPALILAHNHPSGESSPSQADIQITNRIKAALATLDIRLLDHFVVGAGGVVSFAQRGLL